MPLIQVLYLPMDADFGDYSTGASEVHTPSVYGATIDTTIKYAGMGSGKFVKTSSQYVSFGDSEDWNFGSGDFKIDFWINFASVPDVWVWVGIVGQIDGTKQFYICLGPGAPGHQLYVKITGALSALITANWNPIVGTWYHIVLKNELFLGLDYVFLYIDDVIKGSAGHGTMAVIDAPLEIGRSGTAYFDGHIDEFTIWKYTQMGLYSNIGDSWKSDTLKSQIGDTWKTDRLKIAIGENIHLYDKKDIELFTDKDNELSANKRLWKAVI